MYSSVAWVTKPVLSHSSQAQGMLFVLLWKRKALLSRQHLEHNIQKTNKTPGRSNVINKGDRNPNQYSGL